MTPEIRGFPIRRSQDHSSFTSSPGLIAGYNVLHRLLVPRHPPIALSSLSINYKDARVHCVVLNIRAATTHEPATASPHMPRTRNRPPQATDPSGPNSVLIQHHTTTHRFPHPHHHNSSTSSTHDRRQCDAQTVNVPQTRRPSDQGHSPRNRTN